MYVKPNRRNKSKTGKKSLENALGRHLVFAPFFFLNISRLVNTTPADVRKYQFWCPSSRSNISQLESLKSVYWCLWTTEILPLFGIRGFEIEKCSVGFLTFECILHCLFDIACLSFLRVRYSISCLSSVDAFSLHLRLQRDLRVKHELLPDRDPDCASTTRKDNKNI